MIKLSARVISEEFNVKTNAIWTWLSSRGKSARNVRDMIDCYNHYRKKVEGWKEKKVFSEFLQNQDFTQRGLAKEINKRGGNISHAAVSLWFNGKSFPTKNEKTIKILEEIFHINLKDFIRSDDGWEKRPTGCVYVAPKKK